MVRFLDHPSVMPRTIDTRRCAVLYPAIGEAAHRAGASSIGLIDVGASDGLNLRVDRVGITYSNGQSLGDPSAPVQLSSSIVGDRPVPTRGLPEVIARVGVGLDPVDLSDAFDRVPADALPVVTTTWALSRLSLERRLRFLHRLQDAGANRTVAWVSVEGVGVAPAMPTLGDRRAFGHSTIGVALLDRSSLRAEAIGRCWSQGQWLAWLADG
jgi:Uncharacterized protein conserved in bacteria (DUF2332)